MFMSGPSLLASCNHTLDPCDGTELWNAHPPACLYPGPTSRLADLIALDASPIIFELRITDASIYPTHAVYSTEARPSADHGPSSGHPHVGLCVPMRLKDSVDEL